MSWSPQQYMQFEDERTRAARGRWLTQRPLIRHCETALQLRKRRREDIRKIVAECGVPLVD